MNFKIEQIREAELQIDKLVAQEKTMRRAFMADGTVDPKEQKQLDDIDGKIAKLKGAVAKIRAEIEAARRAWEGRAADWSRVQSETAELGTWGHKDHPKVKAEGDKIPPLTTEQDWEEATKQLDATLKVLNPAIDDYRKQVAAKAEYDPLRADTNTRLTRAQAADPKTAEITGLIEKQTGELGVIDKSLGDKDYVTALATLKGMETNQAALEGKIKEARDQKAEFDKEMAALAPRLKEAQGCKFDSLADKLAELGAGEAKINDAAGKQDYLQARSAAAELAPKVDAYMAEYAKVVDAQTLYNSRLPRIDTEMAAITQMKYPDIAAQLQTIEGSDNQMRGMAGAGSFEQANEEMAKLDPLITAYKEAAENARLGEEYAAKKAKAEPGMSKVRTSEYPPLDQMQAKVNADFDAAEKAAGAKDFTKGMALLGDVEVGLGDFETKYAAQKAAQTDYENGLVQIKPRYEAIANSKYPQLAEQEKSLIAAYDRMNAAAGGRDFVTGFAAMSDVERELGVIETAREAIEAKQQEFETRRGPLIQRFDGAMVTDFTQLEDERDKLKTGRADMESAAAGRDFPLALDHLNAVERMLNDLDAQRGNLEAQKKQYEAVLAQIEAGLKKVEDCQHAELTPKKTPIMTMRADMLASAQEEDFGVALERANGLIPLVNEFAKLEVQLEEYKRRLEVLTPRLETVKGFTYKSLKVKQDEIAKLFADMTAQAAKAELTDALAKMGELEKQVGDIIKLNQELTEQQAVYKRLLADLDVKVKPIAANKIKDLENAAKAVADSFAKFKELGDKDEFIQAGEQAKDVERWIEAFRTALDAIEDKKAVYESLKSQADPGYEQAKGKAKDYEEGLEALFKELTTLHGEMDKAGSGDSPDYEAAIAKANAVLAKLKDFDAKWTELAKREEALKAAAEAAYRRLDALPEDAAKKAPDKFKNANGAREDVKTALNQKKLDQAEEKIKALNAAIEKLEGAIKTKEQHKADYDTRLGALKPRVDVANASQFKNKLEKELTDVNAALKEMTGRGEAEDYEGGVKAAPAVDAALTAFNTAEDRLEQLQAVLGERIGEIKKEMQKLDPHVGNPAFAPAIAALKGEQAVMEQQFGAKDLDAANTTSISVRDKLRQLLDQIKAQEESKGKKEEDKDLSDKVKDVAKEVGKKVLDVVVDEVVDTVADKIKAPKVIADGIGKIIKGDTEGGLWDIGKGVVDVMPLAPGSRKIVKAVEQAKEVIDLVRK